MSATEKTATRGLMFRVQTQPQREIKFAVSPVIRNLFRLFRSQHGGSPSVRCSPWQLRGSRVFQALFDICGASRLSTFAILQPLQRASLSAFVVVFRIGFRPSGRNMIPDIATCLCASFVTETFATNCVHVSPFRN